MASRTPRTHRRITAAGAALLLVAACSDDGAGTTAAVEGSSTTATVARASADDTPGSNDPRTTMPAAAGTVDLPTDWSEAVPGTYNLAAIGAGNVTFVVEGGGLWFTRVADFDPIGAPLADSVVRISAAKQAVPGRRDIHFSRPTHLLDPAFIGPPHPEVVNPDEDFWAPDRIEEWLTEAEAGGEWGVTDVEQLTVGGRDAWRFTLQPDYVGCETMEALAPGVRGDWTLCNGGIAWDVASPGDLGQIAVEAWDGGESEFLWINDIGGAPLVVGLHLGYDFDEDWNATARALLDSVAVV